MKKIKCIDDFSEGMISFWQLSGNSHELRSSYVIGKDLVRENLRHRSWSNGTDLPVTGGIP
jgi:hypothetical protein